jgi:pimeloyl-ACP methyl ester carboxylesterase
MACFFKSVATIKDLRIYSNLKHIQVPTLIVRGGGDRVINRRVIQKIAESNPRFSIVEHPVGGHHLMEDEPEWVNEKIQSFFLLN